MRPREVSAIATLAAALFFHHAAGNPAEGTPIDGSSDVEEVLAEAESILAREHVRAADNVRLDDTGRVLSSNKRLATLDAVGRLLRDKDPAALGKWSAEILDSLADPDERVIAARNLAWSGRDSAAAEVVRGILSTAGRESSSRFAVVQAMDGVVYLRTVSLLPEIAEILRVRDFEIAAAQTLDRLASAAPLPVMVALNDDPACLRDRPMLRADYFAKADLSDAEQRLEFEKYLLRADVPTRAKEKAILGLAQRGRMLTVGLFTGAAESSARGPDDSDARVALKGWLSREDLHTLHPAIRECLEWTSPEQ